MRIHLQSHKESPSSFPIDQRAWDEAVARAPDVGAGHVLSFGQTEEAFRAAAPEAEIIVSQTSALARMLPFAAPKLKMIFCTSAGLERLAPFDWLPEGVALLNNRGTHADKAGEFGIMALLMLATRIPTMVTNQQSERWAPLYGSVLAGRHVVVVGLGSLGGAVAMQARRFGMRVTGIRNTAALHEHADPVHGMEQLDAVLPDAEFLVLAAPLTPRTTGLLSRARIAAMPRGAGVINIGRGGLIDQDALLDALDAGQLGGAVLDVFTPEPLPPGHRAWRTPNLVVTPHVSADDPKTYNARSLDLFLANLRHSGRGEPMPNRFDPARGY